MKHVTKLLRRIEAATDPFEGVINEKRAFIKTPNGTWGNKILVNELVSLRIAELIELPIPSGGVCIVDSNTDFDEVIDKIEYDEKIKGICFYSERVDKSNPISNSVTVVKNIANKTDINMIALFDHIIYNEDRHRGNILVQHSIKYGSLLMYIIDQSHVFNLRHRWDKVSLEGLRKKKDFEDIAIMEENNDTLYRTFFELGILNKNKLIEEGERLKELITREALEEILKEIPEDWNCIKEDLAELVNYILYRVSNIDKMIDIILSYKGGV